MNKISVTVIMILLIIFGKPLLTLKDNYTTMTYDEIGEEMLSNVEPFVDTLENISNVAEGTIDLLENALNDITNFLKTIRDFVKGLFEKETGQTCTPNSNGGFTCGTSSGGGGGNYGGR